MLRLKRVWRASLLALFMSLLGIRCRRLAAGGEEYMHALPAPNYQEELEERVPENVQPTSDEALVRSIALTQRYEGSCCKCCAGIPFAAFLGSSCTGGILLATGAVHPLVGAFTLMAWLPCCGCLPCCILEEPPLGKDFWAYRLGDACCECLGERYCPGRQLLCYGR